MKLKCFINYYLQPESPLDEAIRFLKPLQMFSPSSIETHVLAFHIYSRKGKLLLMLRSVKRGRSVDPNHPDVHECSVVLLKTGRTDFCFLRSEPTEPIGCILTLKLSFEQSRKERRSRMKWWGKSWRRNCRGCLVMPLPTNSTKISSNETRTRYLTCLQVSADDDDRSFKC